MDCLKGYLLSIEVKSLLYREYGMYRGLIDVVVDGIKLKIECSRGELTGPLYAIVAGLVPLCRHRYNRMRDARAG